PVGGNCPSALLSIHSSEGPVFAKLDRSWMLRMRHHPDPRHRPAPWLSRLRLLLFPLVGLYSFRRFLGVYRNLLSILCALFLLTLANRAPSWRSRHEDRSRCQSDGAQKDGRGHAPIIRCKSPKTTVLHPSWA